MNDSPYFRSLRVLIAAVILTTVATSGAYAQKAPSGSVSAETKDASAPVADDLAAFKKRMEACGKMAEDRGQRLRCYDSLSENMGLIAPSASEETEETIAKFGFWNVVEQRTRANEEVIYLKLDSSNSVLTSTGLKRSPALIFRCKNRTTDAYIDWGGPLANPRGAKDKIYLSYKIDDGIRMPQEWSFSLDFFSAFSPTPIEFAKSLKSKKTLVIEITPEGQWMERLMYNLDGFNNALAVLTDRCYKTAAPPETISP